MDSGNDASDSSSRRPAGALRPVGAAEDDQDFVLGRESVAAALDGAVSAPVEALDVEFPSEMARTRSIPVAGAGEVTVAAPPSDEYNPDARPTFKAFGVSGMTAVAMPPPASMLTRASSNSHGIVQKPTGSRAVSQVPQTVVEADMNEAPTTPPTLRPAPFFLMPTHCDVPAGNTVELLNDISTALKAANASFVTLPKDCKFKATLHTPTAFVNFRVKVYARGSSAKYAVEVHRRSGCAVLCNRVYRLVMQHLAKTRTVTRPNGDEVVATAAPAKLGPSRFAPREVPADLLSGFAPSSADMKPLCDLLGSEFDEVVQDGARTVAGLCSGPTGNAIASSAEVVGALVGVLDHPNRSSQARSPAASALDAVSSTPAGARLVVAASGVAALLQHVASTLATPEEASKTWHLRRSCLRTVANLACSADGEVVKAVRGNKDVETVLSGCADTDLAPVAARALQALRSA